MKENSEKEWSENNDELSPKEVAELLGENNLSEDELNNVLKSVNIFCKVAYQIFAERENKKECEVINLNEEELKEAA